MKLDKEEGESGVRKAEGGEESKFPSALSGGLGGGKEGRGVKEEAEGRGDKGN